MAPDRHLKNGTLVQLNPKTVRDKAFAGCIFVIAGLEIWGAHGYVQNVNPMAQVPGGQSTYRAKWDEMEVVGRVHWIADVLHNQGE